MEASTTKSRRPGRQFQDGPDLLRRYLDEIGSIPLLSAQDEVRLAKRIEAGVYAAELLRRAQAGETEPVADRRDLETVAREGALAKDQMIRANLRLVVAAAKKRRGSGLVLLDLIQEGNLGLIRAVEKFDYAKGYKFSTYAMWWIRQAMQRGTTFGSRLIRLPEHAVEQVAKIETADRDLAERLGRRPTTEELAAETGLTRERVAELKRVGRVTASLDSPVREDGDTSLGDLIAEAAPELPDAAEAEAAAERVDALLAKLTPVEGEIVAFRYGLDGGGPHTLRETADHVGLSSARVRRLEELAFGRLREESVREDLELVA
ncbi:sigma-70 family RNA polymerase sigma factor [Amycolatopsis pigmentata]|uniref:RNA polymerase sigma factor n=1 Tax=Amycolatopsis pigmentata TaxID=450801 RepID=A0ABW5G2L0_9PSEU